MMTTLQILFVYAMFLFVDSAALYFLWNTACGYFHVEHMGFWPAVFIMLQYRIITMHKSVSFKNGVNVGQWNFGNPSYDAKIVANAVRYLELLLEQLKKLNNK